MYITSRRRTVRLGSLQGLNERFPFRNLTGTYSPPTQAGLYRNGPSSITSSMTALTQPAAGAIACRAIVFLGLSTSCESQFKTCHLTVNRKSEVYFHLVFVSSWFMKSGLRGYQYKLPIMHIFPNTVLNI